MLLPELLDDHKAGPMRYDVVIVGAGPAGAVLAYLLAKLHMEVVSGRMTYRELYRKLLHFNRVLQMLLAFSK